MAGMRRREFLGALGGAATWPVAVRAQTPSKVPYVGIVDFFSSAASADFINPFQEGLREHGLRDGQNIRVEYYSAEQRSDRAAQIVADFVRRNVDLIVAVATPAAHAAKQATTSIPIVMIVANPLATGLVSNLARPEGNLTGISSTSTDLAGKRLELLRELRPGATRIAFLGAANDQNTRTFVQETAAAANSLGVQLQPVLVTGPEEFEAAFAAMTKERSDGVIVQPLFIGHRARLVELAMQARLPMIADQGQFAASGALATYGIDRHASSKRLAYYVDRVLNGVKPADLPIEQPTRFRLIINVRTAKALGLTVPTKLLFTADEVIE
jgi:putative ABC transport system substrate-binding protein